MVVEEVGAVDLEGWGYHVVDEIQEINKRCQTVFSIPSVKYLGRWNLELNFSIVISRRSFWRCVLI